MKRLKDMSMKELMDEIGCFILVTSDIENVILDELKKGSLLSNELNERVKDCKDFSEKTKIIKKFILEKDRLIDRENYVLTQLYRLTETAPKHAQDAVKKEIEACKRILKENNSKKSICITEIDDNKINNLEVVNLNRLLGKSNNSKNKERLLKIEEIINLKVLLGNIETSDIKDFICNIEELGRNLPILVAFNTIIENNKDMKSEEIYSSKNEEIQYLINVKYREEYFENLRKSVYKHAEYLNIDKLLLISSYRILENIEKGIIDKKNVPSYRKVLEEIVSEMESSKTKTKIKISEEENISIKEIKEELEMFQRDEYIGKVRRNEIRYEILEEGKTLYGYTPFEVYCLNLSDKEIDIVIKNIENVEYLMTHNMMNEDLLNYVLKTRTEWSSDILNSLYNDKILKKEDIVKMYEEGRLNIDNIKELKNKFGEEIEEIVSEQELVEKYIKCKKDAEDEENKQALNKYALLYKELKIKESTEEEKENIGENLIELLNSDFEEDDLKEFYKLGLIDIKTAIEWGGESITEEMLLDKTLKPLDVQKLIKEEKIDIDYIREILKTNKLSEEEKLTLICSTFSDDNQIEIRMDLIQYLRFKEEKNYSKKEQQGLTIRQKAENLEKRKKYTMDPGARWKLMTLLDKEYSQELCSDGHIIFKLPNLENGVIIIEKMFKKTKEGTKPSYGNATYIMSEEEFINNETQIVEQTSRKEKRINREQLLKMREEEKTDKIIHTKSWGRNIKQYFDIKEESNYSKQQIEEIDKAIRSIEKSRTLE